MSTEYLKEKKKKKYVHVTNAKNLNAKKTSKSITI